MQDKFLSPLNDYVIKSVFGYNTKHRDKAKINGFHVSVLNGVNRQIAEDTGLPPEDIERP